MYPYGNKFDFFSYGYCGVEFFFIISGFVISYTLQNTNNILTFWKKRIIRLFPGLLICSVLTFTLFRLFDSENLFPRSHSVINLFYSCMLLSPSVLDILFGFLDLHGNYINGSYWSLWPEVSFYFIASSLYYLNKHKFNQNLLITALAIHFTMKLAFWINPEDYPFNATNLISNFLKIIFIFNISTCILWFLLGNLFYKLYTRKLDISTLTTLTLILFLILYENKMWQLNLITLFFVSLFLLFIYAPSFLGFMNNKILTSMGIASYSLYLIHENIGVLLIHKYAGLLGRFSGLFPVLVIVVFISFSLLLYKYFEKPIAVYLKRTWTNKTTI